MAHVDPMRTRLHNVNAGLLTILFLAAEILAFGIFLRVCRPYRKQAVR